MITLATLLTALDDRTSARRQQLSIWITKGGGMLFFAAFGLAATAINGYFIWSTLLAVSSTRATDAIVSSVLAFMAWLVELAALILALIPTTILARQRMAAATLHDLISRGDDDLTPPAALQPRQLAPDELSATAATLRPIRHPADPVRAAGTLAGAMFLLLALVAAIGVFALKPLRAQTGAAAGTLWLVQLALLALMPVYLLAIGAVALRRSPGLGGSVTVDALGLRYRRGRQNCFIPWASVRTLAQFTLSPGDLLGASLVYPATAGSTYYLLDAGADRYVWSVRHRAGNAAFMASETLLRQIVSRTGLPLRDATALAREVAEQSARDAGRLWAQRTPTAGGAGRSLVVMEALKPMAQPPRISRRTLNVAGALALALLLVNALPPLALVRAAPVWSAYAQRLPRVLHATEPIYATDFAQNDGVWPVAQGVGDAQATYAFSGRAYHITGGVGGHFIAAATPQNLGDGAVEITVIQREQSPAIPHPGETGGAAVVFHMQGARFIMFDITPEGNFFLDEHHGTDASGGNWSVLRRGYSPAIHTGLGATNTILYMQRGRRITIYVNDQVVVDDEYAVPYWLGLPLTGAPGVYSDQSAMDTAFTHFAVWRLPPLPDFWASLRPA